MVRCIGMDVHRDFCEVAVAENGGVRSGPRVLTTPEDLEVFAHSLSPTDHVALENTGLAASVAEILRPHVERVVVANPQAVRAIAWAKVKTDRVDARTLAKLLASGFLPEVWPGDKPIRALRRRISRRAQLVRSRTRAKNEVHAVLQRNLVPRPPVTDLFGTTGRAWLEEQALPPDEARTIQACLRQIDFFEAELGALDADIAAVAVASEDIRRLMTIPGVDVTTASTLMATIGHIGRFPTARHLVGYLGLDPRVRQSGVSPARHGSISKRGSAQARHVLVEAAWLLGRTPGPLRAFSQRVAARRGANVAAVAVARKLVVLCWHLLHRGQDYAFARPSLTRAKLRRLELRAGAEPHRGRRRGELISSTQEQRRQESEVIVQAEVAYRRFITDWQATGERVRVPPPGRASHGPRRARQRGRNKPPDPAL